MSNPIDNAWIELVRKVGAGEPEEERQEVSPPECFVSRVRAMRSRLWEYARLLLWRRWSLILLGLALLGYLLVKATVRPDASQLVPVPSPPLLFPE